jgi:hypothetical protein
VERYFRRAFGLALLALICVALYFGLTTAWGLLISVPKELGAALVTGATTILAAAAAIALGRYYERKKEIAAHFREQKVKIYDEFLKEFFSLWETKLADPSNTGGADASGHLVEFLREWHRSIILWGVPEVVGSYVAFLRKLKGGTPDAASLLRMDDFFRSIRHDLGISNYGLERGTFLHLILRDSELFFRAVGKDPSLSLQELSILEKANRSESDS